MRVIAEVSNCPGGETLHPDESEFKANSAATDRNFIEPFPSVR